MSFERIDALYSFRIRDRDYKLRNLKHRQCTSKNQKKWPSGMVSTLSKGDGLLLHKTPPWRVWRPRLAGWGGRLPIRPHGRSC